MAKGDPKGGRPPHEPTEESRRLVRTLAGYGIPREEIARELGICDNTLRKHYHEDAETGATKANAKVIESLYNNAVKNQNVTAQIWWTKVRLGWTEKIAVGGDTDNPIVMKVSIGGNAQD